MKQRTVLLLAALLIAGPKIAHVAAVEERTDTYQQFRTRFDTGSYAEALPLAASVVEMTRSQFGTEAVQLANPLANLATTYYRMGDHGKALDTYREALTILDLQGNALDPRLVPVLHGMGVALRGLQRDGDALVPLKRALDIQRNKDGLFSANQLPVLRHLIASYMAVGLLQEAGREQQYAYTVAETAFGKDDLRMLGPLNEFALWYEQVGRYGEARQLHARAVQLADSKDGPTSLTAVEGMRGIARTYRLGFLNGEAEPVPDLLNSNNPGSLSNNVLTQVMSAPSPEGERALRVALQRIVLARNAPPQLHGQVLLDLGDWYMSGGSETRAIQAYEEAWRVLAPAGATKALETPVALTYNAPAVAVSRRLEDPEKFDEQRVELRLSVDEKGKVREVTVANATAEAEAAERAVMAAVKRAKWRPMFRDGMPVTSTDVAFSELVFVRKPKDSQ